MNIFFLDEDAAKAAKMMPDNYLDKMLLEGVQILSTAIRVKIGSPGFLKQTFKTPVGKTTNVRQYPYCLPDEDPNEPTIYLAYNPNNPLALWIRYSKQNFNWLLKHCQTLAAEFKIRGSKDGEDHESAKILEVCKQLFSSIEADKWKYKQLTPFPIVTTTIIDDDAIVSYRQHMHKKKCEWKNGAPDWWNQDLNDKIGPKPKKNKKGDQENSDQNN